jgi:hypothetical protein
VSFLALVVSVLEDIPRRAVAEARRRAERAA